MFNYLKVKVYHLLKLGEAIRTNDIYEVPGFQTLDDDKDMFDIECH